MIGVIDYGAGNLRNVEAALARLDVPWRRVVTAPSLAGVDAIVLPGVGQFGAAMRRLADARLVEPLRAFLRSGRPVLGICLGMQLLFEGSDEDPSAAGLGILPGRVRRLATARVPHLGWAPVAATATSPLLEGLPEPFYAYFAHSFAVPVETPATIARAAAAGPMAFAAALQQGATFGAQFHPEKSGPAGETLLANFARGVREGFASAVPYRDDEGAPARTTARRIIPCLDVAGGRVVKGLRFRDLRDAGDPVERARAYNDEGADEVCLLDISASTEERGTLLDLVRRVADELTIPFTVGGGVRSVEEMRDLLLAGADRVSIGTAAVENPALLTAAADAFGSQCVIVSIDARAADGGWEVTTHGGRRPARRDAIAWAREAERRGAGEILLNAMDADGTRAGYDVPLTRAVARAVRVPVIASGGAGGPDDMACVLNEGEADAALAASIFHDGAVSIRDVKRALRAAGVEVRL